MGNISHLPSEFVRYHGWKGFKIRVKSECVMHAKLIKSSYNFLRKQQGIGLTDRTQVAWFK